VITSNFNVEGVAVTPRETNSEPIVDPDAELPLTVGLQGLQPIAGWHPKIVQPSSKVQHQKLS
jgi:hypothetical protein